MLKIFKKSFTSLKSKVSFFRTAPINYSRVDINGKTLGCMGRPSKPILNTVTKDHKVVIVLMGANEKAKVADLYADVVNQGIIMKHFVFPDFHSPTIEDYEKFFALYDQAVKENPDASPLIHCGAGNGRTGTMVAALMIREAIMNNMPLGNNSPIDYQLGAFDNREQFQPKTFLGKLINRILLYFFPLPEELKTPDAKIYQACELVHNILGKLRESRPESVETIGQLQSLDRLAKYLDCQNTLSNVARPINTLSEHLIKGASMPHSLAIASDDAKQTDENATLPILKSDR